MKTLKTTRWLGLVLGILFLSTCGSGPDTGLEFG